MEVEGEHHDLSKEEEDTFRRSKRRSRDPSDDYASHYTMGDTSTGASVDGTDKVSYRDKVARKKIRTIWEEVDPMDEGEISDDDLIEEGDGVTWFGVGMTRDEKIEARRPWRNSVIIKVVGRTVGYHYLWKKIRTMWRTQGDPLLIDLVD